MIHSAYPWRITHSRTESCHIWMSLVTYGKSHVTSHIILHMHVSWNTQMHIHSHMRNCIQIPIYIQIHIYIQMRIYTQMQICLWHIHMHISMARTKAYLHTNLYIYDIYTCMNLWHVQKHIYVQMHISVTHTRAYIHGTYKSIST